MYYNEEFYNKKEHYQMLKRICDNECAHEFPKLKDYGPEPFVIDIEQATKNNDSFRQALWTGKNLQLTLMSILPNEDVGLEAHSNLDQFIRVEEGQGFVKMGPTKEDLRFYKDIKDDDAILIPANTWHNIVNTADYPMKLYSIYAPTEHPRGVKQETKDDALRDENH